MWVDGQRQAPAALPREGDPGTHFTVRRVDFGVDLDGYGKSRQHRCSNPGHFSRESQYRLCYPGRLGSTEIGKPKSKAVTVSITTACSSTY
jgi:hypothetical protein